VPPQEGFVVKHRDLHLTGILLALVAFAVVWGGCVFSPDDGERKPDPLPPLPADSPQAVLANMRVAYNRFNYDRYQPLIREDFTFVFNPADVQGSQGEIPEFWTQGPELASAKNMLNPEFQPEDPLYKIDSMELVIQLSGQLRETNLQNAPEGTLESYVNFDLNVEAGAGNLTLLVHSRPLFYFAPDEADAENKIWRIWKIVDGEFIPE
jgi:hypothetical protein